MVASLDGFIARKDGSSDWMETADEFAGGDTMDPEFVEAFLTAVFRCVRPEIFHICNISYHTAVSRCPQLLHCSITQAKA
jgi:hypothetical protein